MKITRTITASEITFTCYNRAKKETGLYTAVFSGKHTEYDKEVERFVRRIEKANRDLSIMDIDNVKVHTGLYAMDEETFMKYAVRIGDGR